MACKVCGASGPRFCVPCRGRYGGRTVRVTRSAPRASSPKSSPRRRRRKASSSSGRKHLSREAFLRRMRAGKLRAARRRGRK